MQTDFSERGITGEEYSVKEKERRLSKNSDLVKIEFS